MRDDIIKVIKVVSVAGARLHSYCCAKDLTYAIDVCTRRPARCGPLAAYRTIPVGGIEFSPQTLLFEADARVYVPAAGDPLSLKTGWFHVGYYRHEVWWGSDPNIIACRSITLRRLIDVSELTMYDNEYVWHNYREAKRLWYHALAKEAGIWRTYANRARSKP
jgi:hypothetical protein